MKIVFTGTKEQLLEELNELAKAVEEGGAEGRYLPDSVRNPDEGLEVDWEIVEDDEEKGILYRIY